MRLRLFSCIFFIRMCRRTSIQQLQRKIYCVGQVLQYCSCSGTEQIISVTFWMSFSIYNCFYIMPEIQVFCVTWTMQTVQEVCSLTSIARIRLCRHKSCSSELPVHEGKHFRTIMQVIDNTSFDSVSYARCTIDNSRVYMAVARYTLKFVYYTNVP